MQRYKNIRKYANLFGENIRKYVNLFSDNIRKYANLFVIILENTQFLNNIIVVFKKKV